MRVCFICTEIFAWGKYGGFGRATRTTGRALARRGVRVFAVVPGGASSARSRSSNEGMVLKLGDRYYHGADCMQVLALMGSSSGVFNRANAAIFRSRRAAQVPYPILRTGRNTVLRLLGRDRLAAAVPDVAARPPGSSRAPGGGLS